MFLWGKCIIIGGTRLNFSLQICASNQIKWYPKLWLDTKQLLRIFCAIEDLNALLQNRNWLAQILRRQSRNLVNDSDLPRLQALQQPQPKVSKVKVKNCYYVAMYLFKKWAYTNYLWSLSNKGNGLDWNEILDCSILEWSKIGTDYIMEIIRMIRLD